MKTLPRFGETEITVENDVITIKQMSYYNSASIQIPVALWHTFCDAVSEEIYPHEFYSSSALPEAIET